MVFPAAFRTARRWRCRTSAAASCSPCARSRWFQRVKDAISSLKDVNRESPGQSKSSQDIALQNASSVRPDQKPAARERDADKAEASKSAEQFEEREPQSAKVIEFPVAHESHLHDLQASATEVFVSGATAPSLHAAVPADSTSLEALKPAAETPVTGTESSADEPFLHAGQSTGRVSKFDSSTSSQWSGNTLSEVEKQLVVLIGPLARVLVKRAATKAKTLDELYSLLATSLASPADRQAFLAGRKAVVGNLATDAPVREQLAELTPRRVIGLESSKLNRQSLDSATRILARYVGPISGVLVKRAAKRAGNTRELFILLAEHVKEADRTRFLQDAGFSDL